MQTLTGVHPSCNASLKSPALTYRRGKALVIPSESPKMTCVQLICAAHPAPLKAQPHPRRLLFLQLLDTTIHPENQVIYREICCQQLVGKAELKTPFGSGMLRHIFKWMSCGKAYCIL